jgi:hypothetical protein
MSTVLGLQIFLFFYSPTYKTMKTLNYSPKSYEIADNQFEQGLKLEGVGKGRGD